jgi:FKBP-type peptidyl-prolyl cis-trans isomerase 2
MKKVANDSTVTVNYTGRLEDGTVFDSSMVEGREPLKTQLGQGQLIKGFEAGLVDMEVGETKTVEIPANEAYGEYLEYLVQEVPKTQMPGDPKFILIKDFKNN